MKKIFAYIFLLSLCTISRGVAQENIFTAGFQYRPIFPSEFFNSGTRSVSQNGIDFSISQKMSYSAGMVLRRGINKQFSFESGINYTKRNFDLTVTDTSFTGKSDFMIVGYEIPVQGMIFLRLADKIYMNTTVGFSMDMYASSVATHDSYFRHYSARHSVFQFAALANLGAEYRTEKIGYFYIGAAYHLPLSYIYSSAISYEPSQEIGRLKLRGNFIALDLRYYFHEEPLKPRKPKKKKTNTPK